MDFDPLDKDTAIAVARSHISLALQNELRKKAGVPLLPVPAAAQAAGPQARGTGEETTVTRRGLLGLAGAATLRGWAGDSLGAAHDLLYQALECLSEKASTDQVKRPSGF